MLKKIANRDIKPSNLLINSHDQIKIADFDASKLMHRSLDTCISYVSTCAYMSLKRFDPDAPGGEYNTYDICPVAVKTLGPSPGTIYVAAQILWCLDELGNKALEGRRRAFHP